jgi:hypothetical protein
MLGKTMMPPKEMRLAIDKLRDEIAEVQQRADKLIAQRINAVAAEISGVPVRPLHDMLRGGSVVYCRCEALKRILYGAI